MRRPTGSYGQYEYFVPTLDVRSVGAGGGSIIRTEGSVLKVGPHSAGARPGPVCFGRGGQQPTVTDAAAVLGYFDPAYFFGGRITLDIAGAGADAALARVGAPLGLDGRQTAAAALRIIDSQMADSIWLTLTQQGHDPRDFSLYGFGGAGGLHAAAIARELGVRSVVVPMSNLAAGWSAFGIAASEALVTEQAAIGLASPFDPEELNRRWPALEARVTEKLLQQGVPAGSIRLRRYAELRYALQINQVAVPAEGGTYDAAAVDRLVSTFEREYERLYGRGSGYAAAGFTLTGLQVHGSAKLSELRVGDVVHEGCGSLDGAAKAPREVTWYAQRGAAEITPAYDGARLGTGAAVTGPAIIEYPDTTVVVPHGCTAGIDPSGSVVIELNAAA